MGCAPHGIEHIQSGRDVPIDREYGVLVYVTLVGYLRRIFEGYSRRLRPFDFILRYGISARRRQENQGVLQCVDPIRGTLRG